MPNPGEILKDPDFKNLSSKERRGIIDSLMEKDKDFSSLDAGEKPRLRSYLYGKYGSDAPQKPASPTAPAAHHDVAGARAQASAAPQRPIRQGLQAKSSAGALKPPPVQTAAPSVNRKQIDDFRLKFFNNGAANMRYNTTGNMDWFSDPEKAAHVLSSAHSTPDQLRVWANRFRMMSPVAQAAIAERVTELHGINQKYTQMRVGAGGMPTARDPRTGEQAGQQGPDDALQILLHGPLGAKKKETEKGFLPEVERQVTGLLKPESVMELGAYGIVSKAGGKIASRAMTGYFASQLGKAAVDKIRGGDIGGGVADIFLGGTMIGAHALGERAVAKKALAAKKPSEPSKPELSPAERQAEIDRYMKKRYPGRHPAEPTPEPQKAPEPAPQKARSRTTLPGEAPKSKTRPEVPPARNSATEGNVAPKPKSTPKPKSEIAKKSHAAKSKVAATAARVAKEVADTQQRVQAELDAPKEVKPSEGGFSISRKSEKGATVEVVDNATGGNVKETPDNYPILNSAGGREGTVSVAKRGSTAYVHWIGSGTSDLDFGNSISGRLGHNALSEFVRDYVKSNPEITHISGYRIGGSNRTSPEHVTVPVERFSREAKPNEGLQGQDAKTAEAKASKKAEPAPAAKAAEVTNTEGGKGQATARAKKGKAEAVATTRPNEFADWVRAQPQDRATYHSAQALYDRYVQDHPNVTREQFGQMLHDLPREEFEPTSTSAAKGFTAKDSTGTERKFGGVRRVTKPTPSPDKPADVPQFQHVETPGSIRLSPNEANTIAVHLPEGHSYEERFANASKPISISPEQADHIRGILQEKLGNKIDKKSFGSLYPPEKKPPTKPSGGAPPPGAPIVGGAPDVQGGSGKPAPARFNALKLPKLAGVEAKWNEVTRQISNRFNRGSTGIERQAIKSGEPGLLRAQRKEAGTKGQVQAMVANTIPKIRDAFGGHEGKFSQFLHYLAEGSLRGARQRWEDAYAQIEALPAESVVDPKVVGKYIDYLEKLQGRPRDESGLDFDRDPENYDTPEDRIVDPAKHDDRTHFAPGLADRAKNLLSNGQSDLLRVLMLGVFAEARDSVGSMADFHPDRVGQGAEDFDTYGRKPEVRKAMKLYKEGIADPVSTAYKANRGQESEYIGSFVNPDKNAAKPESAANPDRVTAYFPLVPVREEGGTGHGVPAAPRAPFHNVPTSGAQFKTGLARQYDTSVKIIMDKMAYDLKRNNRGALVNTLRDMGFAQDIPDGTDWEKLPKTITIGGEEVPAVIKPWKDSQRIVTNGKVGYRPGQNMLVAKFAADELTPQLEHGEYDPSAKPLSAITQAAIFGPNAAMVHNHNLAASLVSGTPSIGNGLGKVPGSIPGLKLITAIRTMMSIDPTHPSRAADIRLLADMGLLHPKTGTVTSSRAVSEMHGYDAKTGKPNVAVRPMSAMLYGMKGTELRTRLALLDIARATAEESGKTATQEDIFDFVSQAGIYSHGLDSAAERFLKRAQLAPFITAGKTQVGLGMRALSGTTPVPRGLSKTAKLNLRARQQISSGIVGATALWFGVFKAATGRLPGKDDKFNEIPVRPEWRKSKSGQMIFGPGDNDVTVSLDITNPALSRGMHATGARSVINGVRAGDAPDKIVSNSYKDILNGLASPVTTSPQVRAGFEATAGVDPYIISWRGPAKEFAPHFTPAVDEEPMGAHRLAAQWINAAINLNPYTQLAGQMSGAPMIHRRPDRKGDPPVTIAMKTARDLFFPRAVPFEPPPKSSASYNPFTSMLPQPPDPAKAIRSALPKP